MTEPPTGIPTDTPAGITVDTLGLLAEASQLAVDLGYDLREEPLGDMPGGPCRVGGVLRIILNLEHAPATRLECLLAVLGDDPRLAAEPKSRLLEERLRAASRDRSPSRP